MDLRINKYEMLRCCLILFALLGILYFILALSIWAVLGLLIPLIYWQDSPIDWGMFMHAGPTLLLFCASVSAFAFAKKRRFRKAAITLGFTLLVSVSWFFFETANDLYQISAPVHRIGNVYSIMTIGERHMYFNWLWHEEVIPYSSMSDKHEYKYGYINEEAQIVIAPQFDHAQRFSQGLAAVCINDLWGYIDNTGHVVIEVQFDQVSLFTEDLAAARIDDRWGYIDATGRFAIEARFDIAGPFREGLAEVKVGDKYERIDKTGRFVHETHEEGKPRFSEGLAEVFVGDKWAYMNESGQVVVDPNFDEAGSFYRGLARVKVRDKWGLIDKTGKYVLRPEFDSVHHHSDGPALIMNDNGRWGYRRGYNMALYSETAKALIWLPHNKVPHAFAEGLSAIFVADRWSFGRRGKFGYMDESAKMVIEPQFDRAGTFSGGLARIGISVDK